MEDCHFTIVEPDGTVAVKIVLLVPEHTVASGLTDPFNGIPKVRDMFSHKLEFSELPLTDANFEILIVPGLFALQILNPILPKGILNSKNDPPPLLQPVALPFSAAKPLFTVSSVLVLPLPEYNLKVDALELISKI